MKSRRRRRRDILKNDTWDRISPPKLTVSIKHYSVYNNWTVSITITTLRPAAIRSCLAQAAASDSAPDSGVRRQRRQTQPHTPHPAPHTPHPTRTPKGCGSGCPGGDSPPPPRGPTGRHTTTVAGCGGGGGGGGTASWRREPRRGRGGAAQPQPHPAPPAAVALMRRGDTPPLAGPRTRRRT
eukprot:gene7741-biopygen10596